MKLTDFKQKKLSRDFSERAASHASSYLKFVLETSLEWISRDILALQQSTLLVFRDQENPFYSLVFFFFF